MLLDVVSESAPLDFLQLNQSRQVDAFRMMHDAIRIGACDDLRAEHLQFLDRVDRNVSASGYDARLAFEALAANLQHFIDEVDEAVSSRFASHERAAPQRALAGEHARFVTIRDALVLPEEISNLARADTDVAGRNIRELAQVTIELGHETLTEAHDLAVRLSFRIEIGAAFRAADRHSGDRVLEDLLEA
jgi:hypothetical protein